MRSRNARLIMSLLDRLNDGLILDELIAADIAVEQGHLKCIDGLYSFKTAREI